MFRKKSTESDEKKTDEKSEQVPQETKSPDNREEGIIIQRKYHPINREKKGTPKIQKPTASSAPQLHSKKLTEERRHTSRHYSPIKSRNTDQKLDNQVKALENEVKNLADAYYKIIEENEWILENFMGNRSQIALDKNLQIILKNLATVSKLIKEKYVGTVKQRIEEIKDMLVTANNEYETLKDLAFSSKPEEVQELCAFRLRTMYTQCAKLLTDYNSLNQSIYKYSQMPEHDWINEQLFKIEKAKVENPQVQYSRLEQLQSHLNKIFSEASNMSADGLREHVRHARNELERAEKIFKLNFNPMKKQLDKAREKELEKEMKEDDNTYWSDWDKSESSDEKQPKEKQQKENQQKTVRTQSATTKPNTLFGEQARGNADKPGVQHGSWPRLKK
jgi:hypothetical protein